MFVLPRVRQEQKQAHNARAREGVGLELAARLSHVWSLRGRLQIKNKLRGENVNLSLPSQRVDRFDDDIANIVAGGKKSGLTFAPEAGTQRLRDIVNKGLTNQELLNGVKTAWKQGWKQVRLASISEWSHRSTSPLFGKLS